MPRTTKLKDHLTMEELGGRYRRARDPVERSHAQIVWLIARGQSAKEAAKITGYSARWVSEVVRRYNEGGPEALGDRRHENPGGRFLLEEDQRRELADALRGRAPDGGLWTGPKVASWIEEKTGERTHPQRGWVYLKRLGFSLKRPRPATTRPTKKSRRLSKNFADEVTAVREAHTGAEVEAWAQDEHRLGLKPILRRVSGPAGANDRWRRCTTATSGSTSTASSGQ